MAMVRVAMASGYRERSGDALRAPQPTGPPKIRATTRRSSRYGKRSRRT
jgi:hypothetical protein